MKVLIQRQVVIDHGLFKARAGKGWVTERKYECRTEVVEAHVSVFVTRRMKFRAIVCEKRPTILNPKNCIKTEVTVGGQEWNKGKLQMYHKIIFKLCAQRLYALVDRLEVHVDEEIKRCTP